MALLLKCDWNATEKSRLLDWRALVGNLSSGIIIGGEKLLYVLEEAEEAQSSPW
jgi:hypothetical protein